MIEGGSEDPLVYSPRKKKEKEGRNMCAQNIFSLWCDRWKCAELLQNKLTHPCEMDPTTTKELTDEYESGLPPPCLARFKNLPQKSEIKDDLSTQIH